MPASLQIGFQNQGASDQPQQLIVQEQNLHSCPDCPKCCSGLTSSDCFQPTHSLAIKSLVTIAEEIVISCARNIISYFLHCYNDNQHC